MNRIDMTIQTIVERLQDSCQGDGCDRLAHETRYEGATKLRLCKPCAQEFDQNREPDAFPGHPEGHYR